MSTNDSVFKDERLQGAMDFFATSLEESAGYEAILQNSEYVGWLSLRDFQFMQPLIAELRDTGISIQFFQSGLLTPVQCRRIESALDLFVTGKNKISNSDQNGNRSVKRLRALIGHSVDHNVNLYMVAD